MPEQIDLAGLYGVGPLVTFEGEELAFTPLDFEAQAQFSRWLERRAWEAQRRAEANQTSDQAARSAAALLGDIAAGEYAFGGNVASKAVWTRAGMAQLFLLSLRPKHPEIDPETIGRFIDHLHAEAVERKERERAGRAAPPAGADAPKVVAR